MVNPNRRSIGPPPNYPPPPPPNTNLQGPMRGGQPSTISPPPPNYPPPPPPNTNLQGPMRGGQQPPTIAPPPPNYPPPPPPNTNLQGPNHQFEQFTHVSPYSMPMQINVFGGMSEQSSIQYDQTKQHLKATGHRKPQDLEIRTEMIKRQLEPSYVHFKHNEHALKSQQPTSQPLGIFTAPEWSFKRPGVPYTSQERQQHIDSFKEISRQHPNMLVSPGTMVWQEKDPNSGHLKLHNTAHVFFNGELIKEIDKAHEGMDVTGYYLPRNAEVRQNLLNEGIKPKTLPFTNQSQALDSFTVRPNANDPFFEVGGRKFALEICADHANKRARHELPNHMPVDIQMVISNGSYIDQGSMVTKPGGVVIGNDASTSPFEGQKNMSPRSVQIGDQNVKQQTISAPLTHQFNKNNVSIDTPSSKMYMGTFPLPPTLQHLQHQGGLDNQARNNNLPPQNPPPPPNLDQN